MKTERYTKWVNKYTKFDPNSRKALNIFFAKNAIGWNGILGEVMEETINQPISSLIMGRRWDEAFVDENGNWKGTKSDDENFIGITKAEQIAAGATVLFPDTGNENHINMAGFRHLQLAIKSSRSDTVGLIGRMGPDTVRFANLSPVAAGAEQNYMGASRYIDNNFDEVLKIHLIVVWPMHGSFILYLIDVPVN